MHTFFHDFETRSRSKLKITGAWKYAEDESTEPLCMAYGVDRNNVQLWVPGLPQPKLMVECIKRGYTISGWNAMSFERAILEVVMGPRFGWVTPKLEQYGDTMLDALTLALPAALEMCGEALGLDIKKDKEGKRLINFLCKPISSGKKKGQFRERADFPKEYTALYSYCKQDVRSEREIYYDLPYHLTGTEKELAVLVAKMNERGLPVDITEVNAIDEGIDYATNKGKELFEKITGISSPSKRAQYLGWLNNNLTAFGFLPLENTQAETLRDLLRDNANLPKQITKAIHTAQHITKTSNAKYKKIKQQICLDGTVKNNFIFNKANTGRLAGAGYQAQNLKSDCEKDPDPIIAAFVDRDYDFIELWGGDVLDVASKLVRAVIKARTGTKFINGDKSGVEARGAAWISGETDILKDLADGQDLYCVTASKMYNKPLALVGKGTIERESGKIAVLAGGFGGGFRALLKMAVKKGMIGMTEALARMHIKNFRTSRPRLVETWAEFGRAALLAMKNPGMVIPTDDTRRFGFTYLGNYLYLILPNKRMLSFPFPKIENEEWYGRNVEQVTAMWVNGYNNKWERRVLTGANFFQSATQAICRDLIMEDHLRIEKDGYPVHLSVHDESQSEVPDDPAYSVDRYKKLMCVQPEWAKGFPLDADCWEGYRFKK